MSTDSTTTEPPKTSEYDDKDFFIPKWDKEAYSINNINDDGERGVKIRLKIQELHVLHFYYSS